MDVHTAVMDHRQATGACQIAVSEQVHGHVSVILIKYIAIFPWDSNYESFYWIWTQTRQSTKVFHDHKMCSMINKCVPLPL